MRAIIASSVAIIVLATGARRASAQATGWNDRIRVSINVGGQLTSTTFTTATTKSVYIETATINTSYTVPKDRLFDSGILFRLSGNFGVGAALSSFAKLQDASITGSIPHPFFFNTPRTINGTASAQRVERVVHIQAAYVIASKRWDLAIAGGPSIFDVNQDLVTDVTFTDVYPYDTAGFGAATITKASATKLGFNVSADFGVRLSKGIGVGGLVRFSRATVDFPPTGPTSGVSTDAGGLQAAGGVRFYF